MILHIDMDAYYAAVEIRDNRALHGKPVIVGGSAEGRGVVCAASYLARSFGVHSAMPAVTARRLCPGAVFISPRMSHYAAVSREIRAIFDRYTPLIEPLSLDEAFLDVTGSRQLFGSAIEIGQRIKQQIQREIRLVASVGVAPNKFLAKIASDLRKPNGFVIVQPHRVPSFLDPLPVGRLWGVGRVTNKALDRLGIRTIGQIRRLPLETMHELFGEHGTHLWHLARGRDDRAVVPDREAKSISHETTFAADIDEDDALRAWLLELADQVGRRLREQALYGNVVQLKMRFCDFRTITRSIKLENPTNVTQEIGDAVCGLFSQRVNPGRLPVRLVGVGVSQLHRQSSRQKLLFDEPAHEQQSQLDAATDEIRKKFGRDAVAKATRLLHDTRHRPQPRPE
jgi:DNA polymerase-4